MTLAYRLVKGSRAGEAFDGAGARLAGGRWNHKGTAVVYIADTLALAALETFVHLNDAAAHLAFVSFRVEIPDALVLNFPPADLPHDWRKEPAPASTKKLGTNWVASATSVALRVPSAIVSTEHDYVLNPGHHDFARITISKPEPFLFDPRMWKST